MGVIIRKYQHCGEKKGKYYNIIINKPGRPGPEIAVNNNENHSDHNPFKPKYTEAQSHEGRGGSCVIQLNQSELLN